jgi:hypothetical protein
VLCPGRRSVRGTITIYFQCFPPGLRNDRLFGTKKHGWGLIARPYRPTYATADASVLPRASALLPDGMGQPTLVRGGIQHVDTPGVHMLGHLEDAIELVIQGRFASRPRQRVVTCR